MGNNKKYDLCALGHAVVDAQVSVSEDVFSTLNLARGEMRLVDDETQEHVLEGLKDLPVSRSSGGSAANSVIILAQLGGRGAFYGMVGADQDGVFYNQEMKALGVLTPVRPHHERGTGKCLVIITPDAERTMITNLGAASCLGPKDLTESEIAWSKWLYLEGYLLTTPQGPELINSALEMAQRHDTKIAVTCSDSFIIDVAGDLLREIIDRSDLVFANATEICRLTEEKNVDSAIGRLHGRKENYVVTKGAEGVTIKYGSELVTVPGIPTKAVDTTGAGDTFAGALLYGITHDYELGAAAQLANFLAAQVVGQLGARLGAPLDQLEGINQYWK